MWAMLPTAKEEGRKLPRKVHVKGIQKATHQGGGGCNNLYYPKEQLRNVVCICSKNSLPVAGSLLKNQGHTWNWSDSDRIRSTVSKKMNFSFK